MLYINIYTVCCDVTLSWMLFSITFSVTQKGRGEKGKFEALACVCGWNFKGVWSCVCVCVCLPHPPPRQDTRFILNLFIIIILTKNTSSFVPTSASLGNFFPWENITIRLVVCVCSRDCGGLECRYRGLNKKRLKFRSRLSPPSSCVYIHLCVGMRVRASRWWNVFFQVPIIRCILYFIFSWANIRHQLGLPVSTSSV